ncbi:hypothetical protein ABHI23_13550 [Xanthomonas citri pv. mangiferaeindicae]|nr:hypothetical protein [Xanthomonas citri]
MAQRLFQIPWRACRAIAIAAADLCPIGNQTACFGAAKTELAPVQYALPARQPWQQPKRQGQAVTHGDGKIAPVRRAAGHQPELGELHRMQRGVAARELTAKAVSTDHARQLRVVDIE